MSSVPPHTHFAADIIGGILSPGLLIGPYPAISGVGPLSGLTVQNAIQVREVVDIVYSSGAPGLVRASKDGTNRWQFGSTGSPESGSNSGSDFALFRYADNGSFLGTTMLADRATGDVTFEGSVTENSSADYKDDIRPFEGDALAMLRGVQIQQYRRKADTEGHERIGIVAEQASKEAPWLTGPSGSGFALGAGLAVTMAAVQALDARLTKLEERG